MLPGCYLRVEGDPKKDCKAQKENCEPSGIDPRFRVRLPLSLRLLFSFFLRVTECNLYGVKHEMDCLALMFDGRSFS